ncbi:DUF5906 domain-containing protein [Ruegeria sp. HKCCD6604]|uniref:DUF5906 domain-containing protein n=1 Tax=Ruegeria sp. HKCCD6604 TaxID=2683000 RepID=UPI0014922D1E|nr:DUF5906 domain-containing protein [Ruegeria sp. HKCCD6604]NOC91561.1 hypothetical protein [Ruegeria sp. HKCCD6604]
MPQPNNQYEQIAWQAETREVRPLEDFPQNLLPPSRLLSGLKVEAAYPYTEPGNSRVVGYQLRYKDRDGQKRFAPFRVVDGKQTFDVALPHKELIYGWDRVNFAEGKVMAAGYKKAEFPPIICEGEKDADSLRTHLPHDIILTNLNGANANLQAPWAMLLPLFIEKEVILWYDHDPAGDAAGNRMLDWLVENGVPLNKIWRVEIPTEEEHWALVKDATDFVEDWLPLKDEMPLAERIDLFINGFRLGERYDRTPVDDEPAVEYVRGADDMRAAINRAGEMSLTCKASIREQIINEMATRFGIGTRAIGSDVKQATDRIKRQRNEARQRNSERTLGQLRQTTSILVPGEWDTNAATFLRENTQDDFFLVRTYQQEVYHHTHAGWLPIGKPDWVAKLRKWLQQAKWARIANDGSLLLDDCHPESLDVEKLDWQLRGETIVDSDEQIPVWSDGSMPEDWADQKDHIALLNDCALNMVTGETVPRNPGLFSPFQVDAEWEPDAPEPTEFLAFLRSVFTEDTEDQITLLQEVMGYALSTNTSLQKAAYIRGPARSGKGTIGGILGRFLAKRTTSTTARKLAGGFGDQNVLDKRLVLIGDMRIGRNTPMEDLAEFLLTVIGGDHSSIARKWKENWEGILKVFFLILSNQRFVGRDTSGVLATRFVYLVTNQSFLGKEDLDLEERLWQNERNAIFRWAVEGYRRVAAQRGFTYSETHKAELAQTTMRMRPVSTFVEQCCEFGNDKKIVGQTLLDAYEMWAENNSGPELDIRTFGQIVTQEFPDTVSKSARHHGKVKKVRYGMDLKPGWTEAALGSVDEDIEQNIHEQVQTSEGPRQNKDLPF